MGREGNAVRRRKWRRRWRRGGVSSLGVGNGNRAVGIHLPGLGPGPIPQVLETPFAKFSAERAHPLQDKDLFLRRVLRILSGFHPHRHPHPSAFSADDDGDDSRPTTNHQQPRQSNPRKVIHLRFHHHTATSTSSSAECGPPASTTSTNADCPPPRLRHHLQQTTHSHMPPHLSPSCEFIMPI